MKLGMTFPQKWKDKSTKDDILLSDILYGVAVEDLFVRLEKSTFHEFLWLTNEQAIGEQAYKKKVKERLDFLYVESGKKNYLSHAVAGQPFDQDVLELLLEELFTIEDADAKWEYKKVNSQTGTALLFNYSYLDMQVPISIYIEVAENIPQKPKQKELKLLLEEKKTYKYLCYSRESILAESLFEIMRKLELISDMKAYDEANQILKNYSVSGRYILEKFSSMGEKEPKVVAMKRLEQIASYKDYGYMKKKWQQYERNHNADKEDWEQVVTRILAFMSPIWKALCENEIFFDDWMPELERFLG